jgi:hypothetical protein
MMTTYEYEGISLEQNNMPNSIILQVNIMGQNQWTPHHELLRTSYREDHISIQDQDKCITYIKVTKIDIHTSQLLDHGIQSLWYEETIHARSSSFYEHESPSHAPQPKLG